MAGWLEGKVALVSGGGSGIGRAIVERFVEQGALVGVLELSAEKIDRLAAELGPKVLPIKGDVTELADNEHAVSETVTAFGKLDVFIGNAGIFDGFSPLAALTSETLGEVFDAIFAVNVKGYLFGAKAALPELVKNNGCMVFTVSNSGFYVGGGGPVYTASKHAVVGLIKQLAHELAPRIRVNGVAPGGTPTDIRLPPVLGMKDGETIKAFDDPGIEDVIRGLTPLQIVPEVQDHTAAYVLLSSNEHARAITGTIIHSDGGLGVRGLMQAAGGMEL